MEITKGRVLAQRFFDIADEISLEHARSLVQQSFRSVRFLAGASHVRVPDPPLEWVLDRRPVDVAGFDKAPCHLRLYAIGAVSVTFVLELETPTTDEALVALSAALLERTIQYAGT
jgi:hypothetical protein